MFSAEEHLNSIGPCVCHIHREHFGGNGDEDCGVESKNSDEANCCPYSCFLDEADSVGKNELTPDEVERCKN